MNWYSKSLSARAFKSEQVPEQAAEKLVNRRLGFERARLPAAPLSFLKDLRHGSKPCPFKTSAPRGFFRSLLVQYPVTSYSPQQLDLSLDASFYFPPASLVRRCCHRRDAAGGRS